MSLLYNVAEIVLHCHQAFVYTKFIDVQLILSHRETVRSSRPLGRTDSLIGYIDGKKIRIPDYFAPELQASNNLRGLSVLIRYNPHGSSYLMGKQQMNVAPHGATRAGTLVKAVGCLKIPAVLALLWLTVSFLRMRPFAACNADER
jgi:hypothetical protein